MHVEDGVNIVLRALFLASVDYFWQSVSGDMNYQGNDSVQMLEALLLKYARVRVIFKMSVIEWYTNAVELQAGEESRISFGEEVFKPLVEKIVVFVPSENL
jgi:hypothetical protein